MGLTWIDFIMRLIPEGLVMILAGYAVAKMKVNIKKFILSGALYAISIFIFRALPVSSVIPSILSMITVVIILVLINNIKPIHAILACIASFVLLIASETINIFIILNGIMGLDINAIFKDATPVMKNLYGYPSLIIMAIIIIPFYCIYSNKSKAKDNQNDEDVNI